MKVAFAHLEIVSDAHGAETRTAHHSKGVLAHKHVAVQLIHLERRHVFDCLIPASIAEFFVELKASITVAIFKEDLRLLSKEKVRNSWRILELTSS